MTMDNSDTKDTPGRGRVELATSFRRDEVELACSMFTKATTGGDVQIMARSAAAQSLHRKFLLMRDKARRAEAGA